MSIRRRISQLPAKLTTQELLSAANELLKRVKSNQRTLMDRGMLSQFQSLGFIDPPLAGDAPYTARHVMQCVAVTNLRDPNMTAERLRAIVQRIDLDYLILLCDDPVEARKKAEVMSNWLQMLERNRGSSRVETKMFNASPTTPSEGDAAKTPMAYAPPTMKKTREVGRKRQPKGNSDDTINISELTAGTLFHQHIDAHSSQPRPVTPPARPSITEDTPTATSTQWSRFQVSRGVELHISGAESGLDEAAMAKLATAIATMLSDEPN